MRLLRRDLEAPFVVDAFMSGLAGREWQTLDTLVRSPSWASDRAEHRALVKALATAISNEGRAERVAALRRLSAESNGRPAWQREAVLEGVQASNRARQPADDRGGTSRRCHGRARRAGPYGLRPVCSLSSGRRPRTAGTRPAARREPRVTGPPEALIDIVLHGRDEDPAYPSMPPLAALPDDQLAAILTYVRQAWGNAAPRFRRGRPRASSRDQVAARCRQRAAHARLSAIETTGWDSPCTLLPRQSRVISAIVSRRQVAPQRHEPLRRRPGVERRLHLASPIDGEPLALAEGRDDACGDQ